MSASFYDLLKYAKTGIASAEMTDYDKLKARIFYPSGYPVTTLTGIPPISFKSDGKPLISWSMLGNGEQTGTPTPDAPIMPEFVGVRTGNLFDKSTITIGKYINAQGVETDSTAQTPMQALNHTDYIEIQPNTNYIYHYKFIYGVYNTIALCWFDASKNLISRVTKDVGQSQKEYILDGTSPANAAFCIINFTGYLPNESMELSFNIGSTALPYEPFGWAEKITSAGQTQTVYLGQVQTFRKIRKLVLTGEEDWQLLNPDPGPGPEIPYFRLADAVTDGIVGEVICTHYVSPTDAISIFNTIRGTRVQDSATYGRILIIRTPANESETLSGFKTFLANQYAAGTPVTVWYVLATPTTGIVNEPLAKIGTYADELHSTDAGVTIPTLKGANVLSVDTDLQPSSVTITGHIKQA